MPGVFARQISRSMPPPTAVKKPIMTQTAGSNPYTIALSAPTTAYKPTEKMSRISMSRSWFSTIIGKTKTTVAAMSEMGMARGCFKI